MGSVSVMKASLGKTAIRKLVPTTAWLVVTASTASAAVKKATLEMTALCLPVLLIVTTEGTASMGSAHARVVMKEKVVQS